MGAARAVERIFRPSDKEKPPKRRFSLVRAKAEKSEPTPEPVAVFRSEQVRSLSGRVLTEAENLFRDIESELEKITSQARQQAPSVAEPENAVSRIRSITLQNVDGTTIRLDRGSNVQRVEHIQVKDQEHQHEYQDDDIAYRESYSRIEYSSPSGRYPVLLHEGEESVNITRLKELHDYLFSPHSRVIDLQTAELQTVRRRLEQ